ncbi:MAG: HAD family hydrolase [Rhodospirillaceae bacterium]|nr:HAD family hydrolase [Rhodospirillaceae bacterium]
MARSTKTITRPKAIIFDWDNTLVDTWVVIHDALNATFNDWGMEKWTIEETKTRVAHSMRDSFPSIFGDDWERAGKEFYGHFEKNHLERLTPLPNAESVVGELFEIGIHMAIVSNKTGRLLRLEVEHLGWDKIFKSVVGSLDAAHDKPAPDPVLLALAGSTINPGNDVWFVGDAAIDMQCAKNSGCFGILVHKNPPKIAEFGDFMPDFHTDELCSLPNLAKT